MFDLFKVAFYITPVFFILEHLEILVTKKKKKKKNSSMCTTLIIINILCLSVFLSFSVSGLKHEEIKQKQPPKHIAHKTYTGLVLT